MYIEEVVSHLVGACYSRTSSEYTDKFSTHSRLMLVCEVATGTPYETTSKRPDLVQPPPGYDSVKAKGVTSEVPSDFKVSAFKGMSSNYTTNRL